MTEVSEPIDMEAGRLFVEAFRFHATSRDMEPPPNWSSLTGAQQNLFAATFRSLVQTAVLQYGPTLAPAAPVSPALPQNVTPENVQHPEPDPTAVTSSASPPLPGSMQIRQTDGA